MKMDFQRGAFSLFVIVFLVGCGQAQTFNSGIDASDASCTNAAMPTQFIVKHYDNSISVIRAESEAAFINGYMKQHASEIRYAEHDYRVHASDVVPTVPTTTIATNWGPAKINAGALWSQNVRGSGVVVAVVDSGMDLTQPQLQNQVYTNPGETGVDGQGRAKQSNGIDDDANGFIDDYAGYDFTVNQPLKGDYQVHGTHVSGIIGAYHQDTVPGQQNYVEGIAPDVKIMPLAFLGADGSGSLSDGVRAIQYAAAAGAKVINASWGGTQCSQALKDEIAALNSKNILFVSAAGNDSEDVDKIMEYPASLNLASQFTVGSTGEFDLMSQFSNYGSIAVHIFAPGEDIVSTVPGGMAALSGTSMATPFVTASLALLLGAVPQATASQLRAALYGSASHNTTFINASQGRLDLAQALTQLQSQH